MLLYNRCGEGSLVTGLGARVIMGTGNPVKRMWLHLKKREPINNV